MMKARIVAILFTILILTVASSAGFAFGIDQITVKFYDSNGNQVTSTLNKYNIAPGAEFRADVYFQGSTTWKNADLAFGWGSATGTGTEFSDTDNKFSLVSQGRPAGSCFDSVTSSQLGGFNYSGSNPRPYGSYVNLASSTTKSTTPVLGYSYVLKNNLAFNTTGQIVIYGLNTSWTSKLYSPTGTAVAIPTVTYTMNSIPEPSSLMAVGCAGVGVLGNLLHRRRKKTAAKS